MGEPTEQKENLIGLTDQILRSDIFANVNPTDLQNRLAANALNNENVKEAFVQSFVQQTVERVKKLSQRKTFAMKEVVTPAQQKILQDRNPEFNLDFSGATRTIGHQFYAATRKLFFKRVEHIIGVNCHSEPAKGYDVIIKDVGANPSKHIGNANIHSCCPQLSVTDAKRKAAYLFTLSNFTPTTENNKAYLKHIDQDSQVICNRRSQSCFIKAPFLTFVHSSYDIRPEDIAASMHAADAETAFLCFHYHPMVQYEESGMFPQGMQFRKFIVDGRIRIAFFFENDGQNGYDHDYIDYMRLLRMFVIEHKTDTITRYVVEYEGQNNDDTVYCTIRKIHSPSIPATTTFRVFTDESLSEKMIIYYWQWSTLNLGTFFNTMSNRILPLRLIVPRVLYNLMFAFALTLTDQKFLVKNILKAGQAFNTREIISGQSVKVPDPIKPCMLNHLAHIIFLMVYIASYECSQTLSKLIDEENRVRNLSNSSFITRFFSNKMRSLVDKFITPPEHLEMFRSIPVEDNDVNPCMSTKNLKEIIDVYSGLAPVPTQKGKFTSLSVKRQFATIVQDKMVKFVTIEEETQALINKKSPFKRSHVNTLPSYIDLEIIEQTIRSNLPEAQEPPGTLDTTSMDVCECVGRFRQVENQSNGNCVYQSIIDHKITKQTVPLIRERLANSPYLRQFANKQEMIDSLTTDDGTEASYATFDVFMLIALEYGIRVCLHEFDQKRNYGNGATYHFNISNNHCEALTPIRELLPCYEINYKYAPKCDTVPPSVDDALNQYFEKPRNHSEARHKESLATARKNYYPFSKLGSGNYISRSGLKTAEIIERYLDREQINSAFTIGGPGGEVQYLVEKHGTRVFGITLQGEGKTPFHQSVHRYNCFTELYGADDSGDINKEENIVSASEEVLSEIPEGVDFFGGDAAPSYEHTCADKEACTTLLISQIKFCIAVLKRGGSAYFKVFSIENARAASAIGFLSEAFGDVMFAKLNMTRPASTEFHIICRDFRPAIDITPRTIDAEPKAEYVHICNGIQSVMNARVLKGLHKLKTCYMSIGKSSGPLIIEVADDVLDNYRSLLCGPEARVGVFQKLLSKVVNYYRGDNEDEIHDQPRTLEDIIRTRFGRETKDEHEAFDESMSFLSASSHYDVQEEDCDSTADVDSIVDCDEIIGETILPTAPDFETLEPIVKIVTPGETSNCHQEPIPSTSFQADQREKLLLEQNFNKPIELHQEEATFITEQTIPRNSTPISHEIEFEEFLKKLPSQYKPVSVQLSHVPNTSCSTVLNNEPPPTYSMAVMDSSRVTITLPGQKNPVGFEPKSPIKLKCVKNIPEKTSDINVCTPQIVPPINTTPTTGELNIKSRNDIIRASMQEYIELVNATLQAELSNHQRVMSSSILPLKSYLHKERGEYGLIESDGKGKIWFVIKPEVDGRPVGSKTYNKVFYDGTFHPYESMRKIKTRALVSEYTHIATEQELLSSLTNVDIENFEPPEDISIIQAVAGAGKTTHIVNKFADPTSNDACNVLLATKEGKIDFIERIVKKYNYDTADLKPLIRTTKSFLINTKKNLRRNVLHIDEALMSHPGELFFCVALSGAKIVRMLGDVMQIPFINRMPAYKVKYDRLQSIIPISEVLSNSFRCPPDVAARLDKAYKANNARYGFKQGMTSSVNILKNTCTFTKMNGSNTFRISPKAKYLTFAQWEKNELSMVYKNLSISTINEYQGKESDEIIVVRLDHFPSSELYKRENHALVALTRHRKKMEYFTRVTDDALCKLIEVGTAIGSKTFEMSRIKAAYTPLKIGAKLPYIQMLTERTPAEYSTLRTTSANIWSTNTPKLFFVPRVGRTNVKKPFTMPDRLVITEFNDNPVIVAIGKENTKTKFTLRNIKDSLASLRLLELNLRNTTIHVDAAILEAIEHSVLASVLQHAFPNCKFVFCTQKVFDTPTEVFDLLTTNGFGAYDNKIFVEKFIETPTIPLFTAYAPTDFSLPEAQRFMNNVFSEACFVDQTMDEWLIINSDLELELGELKYCHITAPYAEHTYDNMVPLLKTAMPIERNYHLREIMLALYKRNRNVPRYNSVVNFDETSDTMLDNLINRCFDQKKLQMVNTQQITVGPGAITDWLVNQETSTLPLIVPDFAIHNSAVNCYNFSIKRQPKPVLTVDAVSSYTALQTIVYHEKPINAIFCGIFREIKSRVHSSLKKHVKIYSDVSTAEFEEILNHDVPHHTISKLSEKLEIDISKYDKSQQELALEFECKLMRFFKVPEYYIRLWYHAHVLTEIYDRTTKLKALIPYQRKSGDASTFIGNTLFLMAVISDLIPVDELEVALFSGDDSLLIGQNLEQYKDSQHFGLKFNLEIKFFTFGYSYFCSKFLLPVRGRWTFTPDPVKLFTKLGRSNIINRAHLEEYRISMIDNIVNYRNALICIRIAEAIRERYGIGADYTSFLRSIPNMTDEETFHSLFEMPSGEVSKNRFYNRFDF